MNYFIYRRQYRKYAAFTDHCGDKVSSFKNWFYRTCP